MSFSRTFPKALLVLLLIFGFFLGAAIPVQAQSAGDIIKGVGDFLLGGPIGFAIGKIAGFSVFDIVGGAVGGLAASIAKALASLVSTIIFVITLAFLEIGGGLISAALDFNSKISTIAEVGYSTTLGLANMGFIVALVVIAFATMLRQEGFSYKKALPRVIIAALLINFGFFIVTQWIIAPVDQVTSAINNATHFDPGSLGQLFSVQNLFEGFAGGFSNFTLTDAGGSFGEVAKAAVSILAAATFSFIGIISIFAMAIMLFIRGIALSILLILLPIAWVMWIFPNLKLPGGGNPWSMWWEQFTRWLLFAPFAMFFFWLSISLASKGEIFPDPGTNLYSAAGTMIVTSGLILGGLLVSNKMGITGAGIALGAVAAGKVWAQAKLKAGAINLGHRALMGGLEDEKALKPWTNKALGLGKGVKGWRGILARPAGAPIRALARRAVQTTDKLEEARKAAAIAKVQAGAPYRYQASLAGLSDFEKLTGAEDLLDKGYAWEHDEFWELVTALGLDPTRAKKLGHRRLEIKLNDAGLNIEAVAAVKPLADFEKSIRDPIESRMKKEGKSKEEIEEAVMSALNTDENKAHVERLTSGIEFNKREKMKDMINILKTNEIPKMEKRLWSGHKGYYGNRSKLSHEAYSNNLRAVISEVRPQAMSGARNNSRGDGVVNWDITAEQGIQRENRYLVRTLVRARGVAETDTAAIRTIQTDVEGWSPQQKIKNVVEAHPEELAATIKEMQKAEANKFINVAIDPKTASPLSIAGKEALRAAEHARIDAVDDKDLAALTASRIQGLARVRRGGLLISSLIAEEG